ncbi:MAG: helix-turn-helix domain-containing protein [Magnetococcales bacterium]|nr:helix-turn-helix domain-containing protein [Magnetococcales bacterium]
MDEPIILTTGEVSKMLRMSRQSVLNAIEKKGLPAVISSNPGVKRRTIFFVRDQLLLWIASKTVNASTTHEPQPVISESAPCRFTNAPTPHSGTLRSQTQTVKELNDRLGQLTKGKRKPLKENGSTMSTSSACGASNPKGALTT